MKPLGLQLYTLREAIAQDLEGVLEKVAEIGYAGAEPFGGIDFEKAAPKLKALGLQVPSMHADPPVGDAKTRTLEMAEAYGVTYIIAPYLPPERFETLDDIKKACEELNTANAAAQEAGYTFGYHNHWWEFKEIDGRPTYEIMLENLDNAAVLEIDTYWVKVGDLDPAQVVTAIGSRAPLLHIKDGPANKEAAMTAVGAGVIDVPAIVKAAENTAEWLIVELDRCDTDMMEAIEKSYTYMTGEGLASGR